MKILPNITPPHQWKLPVTIVLAIFLGLYFYSVYLSNFASYLSDKPETCINCHIMVPQYATWNHSSHRGKASCNDCHVPHNNIFEKYYFKAKDGARHATMFTLRREPQVIHIKEAGIQVVQENCIRCHSQLILASQQQINKKEFHTNRTTRLCWDCHRETPHGTVNSLSIVPNALAPLPKSPVPKWLKDLTEE
ncbi:MAG: cytochrome c nitrite reductase small subunit [Marinilabiliales bacterium]|nr:MAG: cytochrome c nitrite reductase small subunit [Marinilabiliales bacterium]